MCPRLSKLALALVGIVTLLLAACTATSTTPSSTATQSAPAATSAPTVSKPEGSIKIGLAFTGGGSNLDPQTAAPGTFLPMSLFAIYDPIVYMDSNGEKKPGLAERWEVAPDGLSQTLYIRKGVKFHDGSDLTGADVKFTIERLMAPEASAAQATMWRADIAGVDLKDPYTVVIRTKKPIYDLLGYLEVSTAGVVSKKLVEEKGVDALKKAPIGSGPWKLVRNEPGVRIELEASENHWRAKPAFKNITLLNVGEEATLAAMMKTGELDVAQVAYDTMVDLKRSGIKVQSYDAGIQSLGCIWWDRDNPSKSPAGDQRVRKAMKLSIDSDEMIKNLVGGNGAKFAVSTVSTKAWYYDPSVHKIDPYDPEGAKKLLAEAGYANGFPFKLWTHGGFQDTITQAVAGYLRKVGIQATTTPIESGAFWSQVSGQPTPKPEVFNSMRISILTEEKTDWQAVVAYWHSTASSLKISKNPQLDALLEKVPSIADPAERKKQGIQAVLMAQQEYNALPLLTIYQNVALGSKIGSISPWKIVNAWGVAGLQLETITKAK